MSVMSLSLSISIQQISRPVFGTSLFDGAFSLIDTRGIDLRLSLTFVNEKRQELWLLQMYKRYSHGTVIKIDCQNPRYIRLHVTLSIRLPIQDRHAICILQPCHSGPHNVIQKKKERQISSPKERRGIRFACFTPPRA